MSETNETPEGTFANPADQSPEVYAVEKDLRGWRFSRREFLAVAGAAATAAALTGCDDGGAIEVLDAKDRAAAWRSIKAHEETVQALAWSPDGSLLVSTSSDETVKLWSMPEGTLDKTLQHHNAGVGALDISPDGTHMVTGDSDGEIRIWELPKARSRATLSGYGQTGNAAMGVAALAFTPDGRHFVSGSHTGSVQLWDAEDPKPDQVTKMAGHENWVMAVAVSSDGTRLASADLGGVVRLWSLPGGEAAGVRFVEKGNFEAVAFSPDGSLLAAAGRDKLVHLWSLVSQQRLPALEEQNADVRAVTFTPDGMLLIVGSGKLAYLYASNGSLSAKLEGGGSDVSSLAVSPDGTRLAMGDEGGRIWIWSLPDGQLVSALVDLKVNKEDTEGIRFRVVGADGKKVTYTLPCGAPVPAGAVCTCNCVGGSVPTCSCVGHTSSGGGSHYWHPC